MAGAGKRIFMIDDHSSVRQGLETLLTREGYVICGGTGGCAGLMERVGSSQADLALLDISLGAGDGLTYLAVLRKQGIPVLVYTLHDDADTIRKAFAASASGYVSKREEPDALLAALSDVLAGRRHISPRTAQSLARSAISRGAE